MPNFRHEWWHLDHDVPVMRGSGWVPASFHLDSHSHRHGQLLYAAAGAMATTTQSGTWVSPADRATWTPPGFDHSHHFYGRSNVRLVEVPVEFCDRLTPHPSVYAVSALLREILLVFTERPQLRQEVAKHLLMTAIDELMEAPAQQLYLPEASDDRLRTVTDLLRAAPAQNTTLAALARKSGASERTLSRLFQTELGMSFHHWRSLLRVHHALTLLAADTTVTDTAIECGWSNPSSFIEAFTSIVGQTPGSYVAELRRARA